MTDYYSTWESKKPGLILGTAMWGWNTPKASAFEILDSWYAKGLREVDAATNYPIDKNPAHFRLSEQILKEWLKTNGVKDMQVMMKVGSLNNLKTSEIILSLSFLLIMLDEYQWLLGENLDTFMVHWDNRDYIDSVRGTMEALSEAAKRGLRVGVSGLKYPEHYASLNRDFNLDLRVQVKHNVLQSDYERYRAFHGKRSFITYGITGGGIKLSTSDYTSNSTLKVRGVDPAQSISIREEVERVLTDANTVPGRPFLSGFYPAGMVHAFYQTDVQGILVAPSNITQLENTLDFYEVLCKHDYEDVFLELTKIRQQFSSKP